MVFHFYKYIWRVLCILWVGANTDAKGTVSRDFVVCRIIEVCCSMGLSHTGFDAYWVLSHYGVCRSMGLTHFKFMS